MLTTLLVPYIFFTLPSVIFQFFSGDFGKWIALIAIIVRLFFPKEFPGQNQQFS
jgi:fucose 4-O-acetylase-like acetyltransferase